MENKYGKLQKALQAAQLAASMAKTDDGGTCNFDSPTIAYRKMGYSKQKVAETLESVGLTGWTLGSKYWTGVMIVSGATCGQGNCRTSMAEAFSKSLNEAGIASGVYYQVD